MEIKLIYHPHVLELLPALSTFTLQGDYVVSISWLCFSLEFGKETE